MTEAISAQAAALLIHYGFDISRDTVEQLLSEWLAIYPTYWLRLAVIEALYQGRYKTVSVEHILAIWQRRGQPIYHFNHEFENLVCSNHPLDSTVETESILTQNDLDLSDWEIPADSELPPRQFVNMNQKNDEVKELESSQSGGEFSISNWTGESAEISFNEEGITEVKSEDFAQELETTDKLYHPIKHTDFYTKLKAVATEAKREKGN